MRDSSESSRFRLARLYDAAQRMYSEAPYRYMRSGYAFPAWHYFIEVTRRCNLRCKMCQYIDWLENVPVKEQKRGELSTEEWLEVLGQIQRFSLVTFTGGEVFVRSDFMELLAFASRRSRTHFISNTTMLPEERAEAIVALAPRRTGAAGFNFAGTSIEGPGDRHDEIRKMRGAWDRSMAGIRELRRCREASRKSCPHIHVTTVIQQDNVDVLHFMPRLVAEAGADVLNLVTETRMHDLPGFGEVDPSIYRHEDVQWPHIDRSLLAAALNRTLDEARAAGIEVRLPRMPREDLLSYYDGSGIDLKAYECRNAWNTLIIGRTGDAYPCWMQCVGNVRESTLKELWNNAAMRSFRQTCQQKLFAPCPGCCFLEHRGGLQTVRVPSSETATLRAT
ncbi:MAG: radical SAM protein [Candidatus Hydrogenedentes bacterium]|nr:radical SAM protein [Candidatus Hydrogenedentota bacterium]